MSHGEPDVTALLDALRSGAPDAPDRLARVVFEQLHHIATRALRREADGHTLQATELVDEALVRLLGQQAISWVDRAHFYAVAATIIRRILVDHVRRRRSRKRDHGVQVTLDDALANEAGHPLDLIALDTALQELETLSPRQGRVVELRYFAGLDIDETAEVLGVSSATVRRDWTFARAFLLQALSSSS
jgi:RNA polymerase sigma factor (TIGR02999 family)